MDLLLTNIILEKDKKNKMHPFGIDVFGGYGIDFKNGRTPTVGVGIS